MDTQKQRDAEANRIIDALGGTGAVARLVDLSNGAVSQWRENGIPKPWMMYFRRARPRLFRRNVAA